MLAGVIIWFIDWVFVEGETLFGSRSLKTIFDIASALALIPLAYFLFRGARWVAGNLLWRVRRRLIVTYLLVGALPLLLMVALLALVLLAALAQSSVNLVGRQLDGYLEQSQAAAQALSRNLDHLEAANFGADMLRRRLQERADALAAIFPDVTLIVRQSDGAGGASGANGYGFNVTVRGPASENMLNGAAGESPPPPALTAPPPQWLLARLASKGEFHGLWSRKTLSLAPHSCAPHRQIGATALDHLSTQLSDQRKPVRASQPHDRPGGEAGDGEFPPDHDSERAAA
jgi:hypothetical protein